MLPKVHGVPMIAVVVMLAEAHGAPWDCRGSDPEPVLLRSAGPPVGICVVGLMRTLGYEDILRNIGDFMRSLAGPLDFASFFLLTLQDEATKVGFKRQYNGAQPLHYSALSEKVTARLRGDMRAASIAIFHANGSPAASVGRWHWSEFANTRFIAGNYSACPLSINYALHMQFLKQAACGEMMMQYEQQHGAFEYTVRLRPDILSVIPHHHPPVDQMPGLLRMRDTIVPSKLWWPGPNDHFALYRGSTATHCAGLFSAQGLSHMQWHVRRSE